MQNVTAKSSDLQSESTSFPHQNQTVVNPVSNTGAECTSYRFGLGWLSFTYRVADAGQVLADVLHTEKDLLWLISSRLERSRAGFNGYQYARQYLNGATICYSPDREDVFVNLPQQVLDRLHPKRLAKLVFWSAARPGFNLTRLDCYFDDYSRKLTPSLVEGELRAGNFPGRSVQWSTIRSYAGADSEGETVYIGSQHSQFRTRVYDKNLESQGKQNCIRMEFQMRAEFARSYFASLIYSPYTEWGKLAMELLLDKFDFRQRVGCRNKKGKARVGWWAAFIGNLQSVRWRVQAIEPKLIRTIAWLENVLPVQLSMMADVLGWGKFADWIDLLSSDGVKRKKQKHISMVTEYKAQFGLSAA